MRQHPFHILVSLALVAWFAPMCAAADKPVSAKGPLRRMLVGALGLPDEKFLQFVERVKPQVVIMGAFGAPQWAAQKDPRAWLSKWRVVFHRMQRRGVKVVGMIELLNVGNNPKEAARWLDFYNNRWDEKLLGRRPPATAESLLEKRSWPEAKQVGAHAPRGCASNPAWRAVAKALVKALIEAGIDGFITHRNMYGQCGCPFCHAGWESAQPAAAKKTHKSAPLYGHHREHGRLPSALELEAMKFARRAIKQAYDDVFVRHGQSLKPDLLLAQWNHMPYFDELHLDGGHIPRHELTTFAHASADERWSLPIDLWGRGEDFYWYCNWGTCQNTQLDKRFVADVTLYAKLLRSFARGKPYVINKYDFYRPRNMMAEASALGMMAGAIKVPYGTAEDMEVMQRYFRFLERTKDVFANRNGEPMSDVLLVYPRTATHAGDAAGLEMIEVAGRTMTVNHVQFDFVPDDLLSSIQLEKYRVLVAAETTGLPPERLASFKRQGGEVIAVPRTNSKADEPLWRRMKAVVVRGLTPHTGGKPGAEPFRKALLAAPGEERIWVVAPYTVEAHAYQQPGRLVVHLVNYNHREKAAGKSQVEREAPIPAPPVEIRMPLAAETKVKSIRFLDPDKDKTQEVAIKRLGGALKLQTPGFLVYGVIVIEIE